MATNQSANAMNNAKVALVNIQPSTFNPRKHFDENGINELADSIRQQGVLQPINVRPIPDTDRYEIVFGERRYRAALVAGLEEIPAIISSYSDEEAEEIAITENLQRKDVTPIEEAEAYQRLMDSGRHDVQSLALLFGKSESYIRSRLKFTTLIPEIAGLMADDTISIAVANEICRYSEDIQRDVYEKHLKDDNGYNSWRGKKAADVANAIQRDYTSDLERYDFDKSVCALCPQNTNYLLLFSDGGCGKCTNRCCLAEKIADHMVNSIVATMTEQPYMAICRDLYSTNSTVVKRLAEMGYEIEEHDYTSRMPQEPQAPSAEDYDTTEEYEADNERYKAELEGYQADIADLDRKRESGEITLCIKIGATRTTLCYVDNTTKASIGGSSSDKVVTPLAKLEKQDGRNKEIAIEKTIADTKKQIMDVDMTDTKFSAEEEKMLHFFMLSALRKEHYTAVGLPEDNAGYLKDDDKMMIVSNLTAKTKAIIHRDFLIKNFEGAYRGNVTATLLRDFAKKHMPETLKEIEDCHNEVYDKRHQRIEEKKAILMMQEKKEEDMSQASEENTSEEPQSEETAA
ncbi:MAG: ParB/RepB/Spo0J family partition protein [Roseburia sp.]|nr:ParB/RepB/Spo0J family partition protein [Roseburia sp.]MCM1421134.1 ParB/RepB/Spo0J family partition protein [Bacteroides sp.]